MPSAPRPNKKAAKIAYDLLKTPKEKQQPKGDNRPPEKLIKEWKLDSSVAQ
jgi:hypothetical protein